MKTHLLIAIAALTASGISIAQETTSASSTAQARPLTRAEVKADLAMWRRAGLNVLETEGTNAHGKETLRREAEYLRLRNGPEYVAELRRLEGARSHRSAGVGATPGTY